MKVTVQNIHRSLIVFLWNNDQSMVGPKKILSFLTKLAVQYSNYIPVYSKSHQ